jgi:hypothetical protein
VVKLLTGGLLSNYDEKTHGPLDLRFKRSVANAVKSPSARNSNLAA